MGKIFLGNSGTSLLSVFFSVFLIGDYNLYNYIYADEILFILLFPGLDMIRVTIERIVTGKKVYIPDKIHFHHYLLKNKISYIWQIILLLTLLPYLLIITTESIYLTIIISVILYTSIIYFLKNRKND